MSGRLPNNNNAGSNRASGLGAGGGPPGELQFHTFFFSLNANGSLQPAGAVFGANNLPPGLSNMFPSLTFPGAPSPAQQPVARQPAAAQRSAAASGAGGGMASASASRPRSLSVAPELRVVRLPPPPAAAAPGGGGPRGQGHQEDQDDELLVEDDNDDDVIAASASRPSQDHEDDNVEHVEEDNDVGTEDEDKEDGGGDNFFPAFFGPGMMQAPLGPGALQQGPASAAFAQVFQQLLQGALQGAAGGGAGPAGFGGGEDELHRLFTMLTRRTTPADAAAIAALPEVPVSAADVGCKKTCSVCMEEFLLAEAGVLQLPCNHCFHKPCVVPWLSQENNTCPMCRAPLKPAAAAPAAATAAPAAAAASSSADGNGVGAAAAAPAAPAAHSVGSLLGSLFAPLFQLFNSNGQGAAGPVASPGSASSPAPPNGARAGRRGNAGRPLARQESPPAARSPAVGQRRTRSGGATASSSAASSAAEATVDVRSPAATAGASGSPTATRRRVLGPGGFSVTGLHWVRGQGAPERRNPSGEGGMEEGEEVREASREGEKARGASLPSAPSARARREEQELEEAIQASLREASAPSPPPSSSSSCSSSAPSLLDSDDSLATVLLESLHSLSLPELIDQAAREGVAVPPGREQDAGFLVRALATRMGVVVHTDEPSGGFYPPPASAPASSAAAGSAAGSAPSAAAAAFLPASLPAEPLIGDASAYTLRASLPDGTFLERRWAASDSLAAVARWVLSNDRAGAFNLDEGDGLPRLSLRPMGGLGAPFARAAWGSTALGRSGLEQWDTIVCEPLALVVTA